jgi:hypothetical protein
LGELVGHKVHIFSNPHHARIDGVLEAVDDHFVRFSEAVAYTGPMHGNVVPWLLVPLHRIRLIKPEAK